MSSKQKQELKNLHGSNRNFNVHRRFSTSPELLFNCLPTTRSRESEIIGCLRKFPQMGAFGNYFAKNFPKPPAAIKFGQAYICNFWFWDLAKSHFFFGIPKQSVTVRCKSRASSVSSQHSSRSERWLRTDDPDPPLQAFRALMFSWFETETSESSRGVDPSSPSMGALHAMRTEQKTKEYK